MKKIVSLLCGLGVSVPLLAQPDVRVRLSFNAEANRYEVYASPNFTANRYAWGPSQVSVVVPQQVADAPLTVRSNQAGLWLDQSVVYSPSVSGSHDFHGVASQGGKVDLVAGEETLLFDFSLPQGYVEGVRLFDASHDPVSTSRGMAGGDFRSYMSDERGGKPVTVDARQAELKELTGGARVASGDGSVLWQVVAYPNPSPTGTFRLYLKGFDRNEVVRVEVASVSGKLLKQFDESVESLAGRAIMLGAGVADSFLLVSLTRPSTQQRFSQKLWIRD